VMLKGPASERGPSQIHEAGDRNKYRRRRQQPRATEKAASRRAHEHEYMLPVCGGPICGGRQIKQSELRWLVWLLGAFCRERSCAGAQRIKQDRKQRSKIFSRGRLDLFLKKAAEVKGR